ncbi:hypothetical protein [Streptomyces sp. A0958]|nr:hypothetical protein [Streptomyces sp. A0958]
MKHAIARLLKPVRRRLSPAQRQQPPVVHPHAYAYPYSCTCAHRAVA